MIRNLHAIDQPGGIAEAAVLRLSVDSVRLQTLDNNERHAWLLFGKEATRDAARAAGLRDDQFRLLPMPVGLHRRIPWAMTRAKGLMSQAHRVFCWTEGTAQIASILGCAQVVRRVHDAVACPFAKRIIDEAYTTLNHTPQIDRLSLRRQWGVKDDTTVVALLGDRIQKIDSSAAALAMAFTHEGFRASKPAIADIRLLCHPLGKRRAEAAMLTELLRFGRLILQDSAVLTPWSVLAGCDVALAPCPGEAGLSRLWADAMGVPVITPKGVDMPQLPELEHVVHARSGLPKDLADALANWVQGRAMIAAE